MATPKKPAASAPLPHIGTEPELPVHSAHVAVGASNEEINAREAEREARRIAEGRPLIEVVRDGSKPQFTATDIGKQIEERGDIRDHMIDDGWPEDLMLAPNPMEEALGPHKREGMSYMFQSESVQKVNGTRGYRPVKDAKGNPVTMGTLVAMEIPTRIAKARAKKYEDEAKLQIKDMDFAYRQAVARSSEDSGPGVTNSDAARPITRQSEYETARRFTNGATGERVVIG